MNKEQRKSQFSLSLIFFFVVFAILSVSLLLASAIVYILTRSGVTVSVNGGMEELSTVILLMTVISAVLGGALALFAGRIPLKPVNRIIEGMNRLASGDFKARLSFGKGVSSYRAFADVRDSFNKMAEELENTQMIRSDFVNNFSHEFKTPIVSIAGFAKLLKRGNLTQEQQQEYIGIIDDESLRLASMATNVLSLTRVENQTILTGVSRFNLSEQIRSCVLLLESKWSDRALEFELEFPEYTVCAGEELLKEVWINLIDNAVKFTPEYGTVKVTIEAGEADYRVSVINTGSEIAPEDREKIFNKFYQADTSHATPGNGVGLAIVKRVVQLHGGRVFAESGQGVTAFTVVIPQNAEEIRA